MLDFQVAFDKLAQFETAGEIREFVSAGGYKGIPCAVSQCPIAAFLTQETGETVAVEPLIIVRQTTLEDKLNQVSRPSYTPTHAMIHFINRFDDLEYPELVVDDYDYSFMGLGN